ncbi:serine/threonine protein kinase [Myxococcus llanfairpwllgwyngyllgogerychwyrndrobwllllantysiliogogogochensis]|uniref:Serine/threonine protein kinase n=1 Tax=Myxococcus llanfairpwllgwyngyllgogerychwyrndrobwllllantysiliogogogochensis TaxID=2590453 RepID=A0A540WU35_9BACT|nr:serine/threonine-protein kinase [Myxococcus llanfairpwllgwyngyllgogerychwyrndrobwllllantysiliogogogochensis]TQF12427.1 serine/threonine protein kinase [Myxococcus llanfairpwllgwyngyllgogerychwyrndrobwllllantysiliogogogochensis]
MNPQSFGKYQLLKKLATGGMAEVWLARQSGIEGFHKNLVVKRILPHLAEDREFVEMFRNEALIAARFNHPNIAQVYEFGEANGTYYIAMEFIHGEDLGRVMRKAASAGQWIARPLAIRIVAAACEGLHYAHSRTDDAGRPLRVVHRDISPQNILISFDGSVKLVDFGIAKAADQASLTKSGAIKGKFAYMAPEQAAGKPLDGRADIFAIGLVLYELLTGVRPLKRDSELATLQAAMECAIQPPSQVADVPEEMDPVVMRAVTKNADDRYRDARTFQTALEEILVGQRWVAGSVQISELMETLFADRLADEKVQGQVVPVDDDASGNSGSPVPPTPPPQERGRGRPSSADMSWDAPPGEASAPRERGGRAAPSRSAPPPPPRRTGASAQPVVEEDPGEWDAPSGDLDVPPRRRGGTSDSMRRPSNANVTQVARTSSRSDLRSAVTNPGEPPPSPPRRSMTRAQPVVDVDAPPPPRSRTSASLDLDERTRMEDEDDERTMLPPPEPPPRRRTGMQSQVSAPEPPPRRRTSSRAEMSVPPPSRSRVSLSSAPAVRPDDDVDRALSDDSRRTRRTMATRNVATLGFIVGLLAVVAIFHKPILAVLSATASDGQGVRLTINTNERVKVSVRHANGCGGSQPITELGMTPLTLVSGAHLQDTLILENEQQGIYKEDTDTLAFGEPGQAKVLTQEFRRGSLLLLLKPDSVRNITVRRRDQDVGIYQGGNGKGLKIELMEGKHKLELNGGPLKEPFHFEVDIKPNSINRETQDLSAFLG